MTANTTDSILTPTSKIRQDRDDRLIDSRWKISRASVGDAYSRKLVKFNFLTLSDRSAPSRWHSFRRSCGFVNNLFSGSHEQGLTVGLLLHACVDNIPEDLTKGILQT